eukprot:TRINITY_DN3265_c0_g1_i2.p1 TRINITY_DN3265_c0_g1~~TRINITY_DN3265_c0_g1_i2.p1  ORF type:complete len:164 (+),score=54.78 TRINITY_DN3265_c0_g1_i2:53-544(+)
MERGKEFYDPLLKEAKGLLEGEKDLIANAANISSLIFHALNSQSNNSVNWVGFYFMRKGELVLGPFHGKPACIRIKVGRGVCGTCVKEKKTQLVPDVHEFKDHIACDSASNSEIVVPVFGKDGEVLAVFDLDSIHINTFTTEDQKYLEQIADKIAEGCDWSVL